MPALRGGQMTDLARSEGRALKNQWSDREALRCVRDHRGAGVNEDLALRVYTSRLLGREPKLVLHGGGNTSVKTVMPDLMGNETKVLCVKGSGMDMGDIDHEGLPAVRLEPLQEMVSLRSLSDEPIRGDAAAGVPSAQVHRSHAFERGVGSDRPRTR